MYAGDKTFLFVAALLAFCPVAAAQSVAPANPHAVSPTVIPGAKNAVRGAVHGLVTGSDDNHAIAGVRVVIRRAGETTEKELRTDENGKFASQDLRAGEYSIKFSAEGKLAHSEKLVVKPGVDVELNANLEPLESADLLRVTGKRTLTHPEKTSNETHIDKKYLDEIGNGNDLRDVINTAPGIQRDSVGNIITRGEHDAVSYTLDGAVLPEAAGVLQQGQFASPHSLQSLNVDIGGYQASDGGGPLGAIVKMKSLPLQSKPVLETGTQLGGPMSGGTNFYGSTALSQDTKSLWNKLRVESSGSIFATKLGIEPGTKNFRRDAKIQFNIINKVQFQPTVNDRFTLVGSINEAYLHQPTSPISRNAGVKIGEHDRQNFVMLSYKHRFEHFFDEANLHFINSFYSQHIWQPTAFDPNPIINGNGLLRSASVDARRYNYAFSAQGDVTKTVFSTHHLTAGFLSEIRPVKTQLNEAVFDANPLSPTYSLMISPFTGKPGGPDFIGPMGKYHGFRYIQSAYLQDTWKPKRGFLKRLTLDTGVRFDVDHGVFGNAMGIAETVAAIPGTQPFNTAPFKRNTQTNAQLSGRYGAAFAITKTTTARASFSNIFVPAPVDYFLTPFAVTTPPSPTNGIFGGSPRPLQAMRGRLVDAGIEHQFGPRFLFRNSAYYKKIYHFGDSGVINNSLVYNRLTNNEQESYGYETRVEMKPSRDGTGFYGYASNTLSVAYLRGSRRNDGEFWDISPTAATTTYPDHDRRETLQAALGYRGKSNFWILSTLSYYTGVKDELPPAIYGSQPARVKPAYIIGLNAGVNVPGNWKRRFRGLPDSVEVRIENLTNNVTPINLGSPFQGTRYTLPIRVLAGCNWKVI